MPRFSQRRKSKRRMTRSKRGGAIQVNDALMYKPPGAVSGKRLTVTDIQGTNCFFNDNGRTNFIDCEQLEKNSFTPSQALSSMKLLDIPKGTEQITRDGYAPEFNKDDLYYSKGEYKLASDYPKGGFRRVKRRRRTQKKQRR